MDDVRKLCPNAKVDSSLSIVGSRSENAKEELKSWCI
ncbi:unknown [Clostridium sp. CAG:451]|nr:unknown [Clostridium sp. CAG:451]